MNPQVSHLRLILWTALAGSIFYILSSGLITSRLAAQQPAETAGPSATAAPVGSGEPAPPAPRLPDKSINLFQLVIKGGVFMIPIFSLSLLSGTMVVERFLGLRRQRVLPEPLVTALGQLATAQGAFDPRKAYRLCQEHPSAAANVIRAMLLKVGRPVSEIEMAVAQASQREADKLYKNVRWINIAASLSTMLGLIGTIQGMILAFHQLTGLAPGTDRTEVLAGGIYTALVTTFAGLAVAIPSAFFSHYFEGRVQSIFHEIDELVFSLLPQLERYEGRLRFNRQMGDGDVPPPEKTERQEKPAASLAGRT